MKAIHANPQDVRNLFARKFIIPDFQRPYSWDVDQCHKLWEDLINFAEHQPSKSEKYFLGNIVIHPEQNSWVVIDGQQRLTTLLLLIKAFHSKAGTVHALERCLRMEDPLTSSLTDELRIESRVLEEDKQHLAEIIFQNGKDTPSHSKLKMNFLFFVKNISNWVISRNSNTEDLNRLILILLDQIVLLPIQCDSEDDALTIFETINNRGIALTDADIFKAKLYQSSHRKKGEFIEKWNILENHEWLFRVYMYVLRAKEGDTSKEIGLRSYFINEKKRLQINWESVVDSLLLFHGISFWESPNDRDEIEKGVLATYPNQYWNFPLYVYLYKYGHLTQEGQFVLPEHKLSQYRTLVEKTMKYCFLKGVVHNSVHSVRETIFKVCALIEKEGDFYLEYERSATSDYEEFRRRIENLQYGKYLRGLVLISSYCHPQQDIHDYKTNMKKYTIEHILPRKWNDYDKWTNESWQRAVNSLGNLIPLEQTLNSSAQNEFFMRKQKYYRDSSVQDALDLASSLGQTSEVPQEGDKKGAVWYPSDYEKRHNDVTSRLLSYFLEPF